MTIKIAGKNFPDTIEEFIDDKTHFTAAFLKFLKRSAAEENLLFVLQNRRKAEPKALYDMFIAPGSRLEVNISSDLRSRMVARAKTNDFSRSNWNKDLLETEREMVRIMDTNYSTSFPKSMEYLKVVESSIIKSITKTTPTLQSYIKAMANKNFCDDKNLLTCIKYTRFAALLNRKAHPKASGVETIAKKAYEQLLKKHSLKLMKYSEWQKTVVKLL
ncbi:hypothetical protein [Phaeobacter sp. HF9A]|uniref:hypothetical protein n=1 Tax=Phaeobacter sp. HF9A TaxID=2721561 RepID=UPI00142F824E|nr:hypothetical protein [Phaeobacter sp. HF9A]NIZ14011.1 hypothetical protein [Phaeobacter sp. HF9A]